MPQKLSLLRILLCSLFFFLFLTIPFSSVHAQQYGLVPCGVDRNNPGTPWDETEDCQIQHTLLLIQILVNFALWTLVPIIIVLLVVATGAIFFFQFGGSEVMAKVRTIWSAVFKGVLILLFSWLFLNYLLGFLGFDINIFGRWYEITP